VSGLSFFTPMDKKSRFNFGPETFGDCISPNFCY